MLQKIYPLTKHYFSFVILILILLVFIPTPTFIELFALKPNSGAKEFFSEPWRLVTAHFIHANWFHLFIVIVHLILLRFIFRRWLSGNLLILFLLFSSIFTSMGLWFTSNLLFYVGFSGIFHGLLVYLILLHWRTSPLLFGIVLAGLIGKIVYEQCYGENTAIAHLIGMSIAVDSHALGLIAGLIFYFLAQIGNFLCRKN